MVMKCLECVQDEGIYVQVNISIDCRVEEGRGPIVKWCIGTGIGG